MVKGNLGLKFSIKKCVAWGGELNSEQDWYEYTQGNKQLQATQTLPALKQVPPMQRRRLSPFAKLSLHCALSAGEGYLDSIPSVFASRHGDLPKTSKLISDVAAQELLSPTQFGLSVHNAVGGLFSIFTNNKSPLTAISAGEDTFFTAIIDAVSKLNSNKYQRILLVFTETLVPSFYQQYIVQDEVSIATALLIEPVSESNNSRDVFNLNMSSQCQQSTQVMEENAQMQVLSFLSFYYGNKKDVTVNSKRHQWTLTKES